MHNNVDENMKNIEETIWDTITNSAKKRFDYKSLEEVFRKMGDGNVAENILCKIIVGLASGETKEVLARQINTEIILLGYCIEEHYLEKLLEHKEEELKTEIPVAQFAHAMLSQGSHHVTILNEVLKMLNRPPQN